jgi:hypothetical protein
MFSIILHGIVAEASFSHSRDVIGLKQSQSTGETLGETVVVRPHPRAIIRFSAGTDGELDNANTDNNSEMNKEVEDRKLHQMAKFHDFLDMCQDSQKHPAIQMESRT